MQHECLSIFISSARNPPVFAETLLSLHLLFSVAQLWRHLARTGAWASFDFWCQHWPHLQKRPIRNCFSWESWEMLTDRSWNHVLLSQFNFFAMICWFGNFSMVDKNRQGLWLEIVKLCQKTIGTNLNDPGHVYQVRATQRQRPPWWSLNTHFMQSFDFQVSFSQGEPNKTDIRSLFPQLFDFYTSCRPSCTHTLTKDWWTLEFL